MEGWGGGGERECVGDLGGNNEFQRKFRQNGLTLFASESEGRYDRLRSRVAHERFRQSHVHYILGFLTKSVDCMKASKNEK